MLFLEWASIVGIQALHGEETQNEACIVCKEELDGEASMLPGCISANSILSNPNAYCGHKGHSECLVNWASENCACGMCNAPLLRFDDGDGNHKQYLVADANAVLGHF